MARKIKLVKLTKPQKGQDTSYTEILLEEFKEQFKIFGEGLEFLQEKVNKIDNIEKQLEFIEKKLIIIEREISDIKAEVKIIRTVLDKKADIDLLNKLERRVIILENELATLRRNSK
jgi:hypothetical protein